MQKESRFSRVIREGNNIKKVSREPRIGVIIKEVRIIRVEQC